MSPTLSAGAKRATIVRPALCVAPRHMPATHPTARNTLSASAATPTVNLSVSRILMESVQQGPGGCASGYPLDSALDSRTTDRGKPSPNPFQPPPRARRGVNTKEVIDARRISPKSSFSKRMPVSNSGHRYRSTHFPPQGSLSPHSLPAHTGPFGRFHPGPKQTEIPFVFRLTH